MLGSGREDPELVPCWAIGLAPDAQRFARLLPGDSQGIYRVACRPLLIATGFKRNWHKLAIDWSMDEINFRYAVDK